MVIESTPLTLPRWWDAESAALSAVDPYELEADRAGAEHGVLAGLLDDPDELAEAMAAEAPYVEDAFADELEVRRLVRALTAELAADPEPDERRTGSSREGEWPPDFAVRGWAA